MGRGEDEHEHEVEAVTRAWSSLHIFEAIKWHEYANALAQHQPHSHSQSQSQPDPDSLQSQS